MPVRNARRLSNAQSCGTGPGSILLDTAAQQVLVHPHAAAVAADVDDVAVMQQAVDQRRGHDLVAEHAAPLLEALVRRQHRRGALMAGVDELEEQDRAVLGDRQLADLVHLCCAQHQSSRRTRGLT